MPARKRHKKAEEHRDPIVRFAEALKRTELREQKERERQAEAKEEAKRAAIHAEHLRLARIELDESIAKVKAARAARSGIAEADQLWQIAKAKVIELETGAAPKWASGRATDGSATDDENADPSESADELG